MEKLINRVRSLLSVGATMQDAHDCVVGSDHDEVEFFFAYHAAKRLMGA